MNEVREINRTEYIIMLLVCYIIMYSVLMLLVCYMGGSVAEWLACLTQAQKGPGSNRSRDAVG